MDNQLVQRRATLMEQIRRDQAHLRQAIQNLRVVVRRRADVGQHIADQPYRWLLGGFIVGLWLGLRDGKTAH